MGGGSVTVSIRPWSDADTTVLEGNNTPEMTRFLGGPESAEKLAWRQRRFLDGWTDGDAWVSVVLVDGEPAGSVGYWNTEYGGAQAFEAGWSIHPGFQGRGVATAALALAVAEARTRATPERRMLYAFPRIDNAASNRLCEAAGLVFVREEPFEYPEGFPITVNTWCLDLLADEPAA
jgi:RimJ/RimL family protein N-acetyltransferase